MSLTPPIQPITTERLVLELLRVEHASEMVKVFSGPELYEYTGGVPPTLDELTERYTIQCAGSGHDDEQWHNWIARLTSSDEAIGYVQATVKPFDAEVAWLIGSTWQGNGYAQEASAAMCSWLKASGVDSVLAWIHRDHQASHRVAQVGTAVAFGVRPRSYRRGGRADSPS